MRFSHLLRSWLSTEADGPARRQIRRRPVRWPLELQTLEDRSLMNGYLAIGAGPGAQPLVAIRTDRINAINQGGVNNVPPERGPLTPTADGTTDTTSQTFLAYTPTFLGGVATAAGNFDGNYTTPDSLVTAAGPGGGPHVIVWRMRQAADGNIVTDGIIDQFMAYDVRFAGGVRVTTGDLDGDGRAELIVSAGPGGGPHVKIYSLNPTTNKFEVKFQFMAYDPKFTGGVSIASGQGYQTPLEIRQVLNNQLPTTFQQISYLPPNTQPGFSTNPNLNFPLMGSDAPFLGEGGSFTLNTAGNAFLPYITVGSGVMQYVGGNLLNNYGNIAYQPNVRGATATPPATQPLVFATWAANNANIPAWAQPNTPYGPFVEIAPSTGSGASIVPFTQPPGQVNSRNQLILGAGPGGGPHVKILDFVNDASGLHINDQIGFMAFDPAFRGGVNVSIGDVAALPAFYPRGFLPDNTSTLLETRTFPTLTDVYAQFQPEVIVSTASGGNMTRVYADFNPLHVLRTSITQLDLEPLLTDTALIHDSNNPLGGFNSLVDVPSFNNPIDAQFRGQILTTSAALVFNGTEASALAEDVYAAGPDPGNLPARGPRVRTFNRLGTSPSYIRATDIAPTTVAINTPIDDFQAFTSGAFPGGAGGVAFGFGVLPPALRGVNGSSVIELPPIALPTTLNNPILILPPGINLGAPAGGGGGGTTG